MAEERKRKGRHGNKKSHEETGEKVKEEYGTEYYEEIGSLGSSSRVDDPDEEENVEEDEVRKTPDNSDSSLLDD